MRVPDGTRSFTVSTSPHLAERFAAHLRDRFRRGVPTAVTWVNHYTAPLMLEHAEDASRIDFIGVDGLLLARLLGGVGRTSADLALPPLLRGVGSARVLLIGGSPESSARARDTIGRLVAPSSSVDAVDGFDGLPPIEEVGRVVRDGSYDICVVGLGGGLQDRYAAAIRAAQCRLAVTCGGFLDQVSNPAYYPAWAYATRLNWAVRVAREPARLWRRYTLDAARFVRNWPRHRDALAQLEGLRRYRLLMEFDT